MGRTCFHMQLIYPARSQLDRREEDMSLHLRKTLPLVCSKLSVLISLFAIVGLIALDEADA